MFFTNLRQRRVLVVEDDYLQASDMAAALEAQGGSVVGPCPGLEEGIRAMGGDVEAAILDIRLNAELVFGVAWERRCKSRPR